MVDPSGASYVGAFSLALKGVEAIKGMVTTADAKKQAAELFEIILAGQRSALEESVKQRALLEAVGDLEKKLARFEKWSTEKSRYVLASPWQGGLIRALKKASSDGEPPHWICTTCYEDGKKSILNDKLVIPTTGPRHVGVECPVCKTHVASGWAGGQIERKYAEEMP